MDLLYGLQGMAAASDEDAIIEDEPVAGNFDEGLDMDASKLPSPAELLKMLDGMSGLSDEDREGLRKDLLKNVENGNDYLRLPPPSEPFTSQALILLGLLAVIALIFAPVECRGFRRNGR